VYSVSIAELTAINIQPYW